ncbi:MAG TPA: hypothetical protein VII56_16165 [Rhizomicrobium sp.]
MPKSHRQGSNEAVQNRKREKVRDALFDMETPLNEVEALLRALDLMGAGMKGRGDEGGGEAVAVVADCALDRLNALKKKWNTVFNCADL